MAPGARLLLATYTDLISGVVSVSWFLVVFGNWNVLTVLPAARTVVAGSLGGLIVGLALHQALYIYRNPETAAEHEVMPPVPSHYRSSYTADTAWRAAGKSLLAAVTGGTIFVAWPLLCPWCSIAVVLRFLTVAVSV